MQLEMARKRVAAQRETVMAQAVIQRVETEKARRRSRVLILLR